MKKIIPLLFTLFSIGSLLAQEVFQAALSGRQEVYAVATAGTGNVTATLTGNVLVVSGEFFRLSSNFDATVAGGSHLHIAPAGRNGGIAYNLIPLLEPDLRSGGFVGTTNTFTLTDEEAEELRAGNFYVNIHTTAFGGGELRGQLLPQSDAYFWTNLFGSNEVPSVMTDAVGALALTVTGDQLVVTGSFSDLSSALNTAVGGGVHLHLAAPGSNGDVEVVLNATTSADNQNGVFLPEDNTFTLTAAQLTAMQQGRIYANVHSLDFPAGELRGQIGSTEGAVFRAHLAAANEIPLTTSLASGQILVSMTDTTMIVTGSFRDLESDIDTDILGGIHLHTAVAGRNGGVNLPLTLDIDADNRGARVEAITNTYELLPGIRDTLLQRGFYINIHTLDNGAGELRGQVLPECQYVLTAPLTGSQEMPDVSTSAYGMVKLEVSGDRAVATGSYNDLSGELNIDILGGAHIHTGLPGRNGDVVFLLNSELGLDNQNGVFMATDNVFETTTGLRDTLRSRGMYVNIHTLTNAAGEVRGNLLGEAANYFFAPLSGASEAVPVNTAARGMVAMEVSANSSVAVGSYMDLSSPVATDIAGGAHLHTGLAGSNGPVLIPLSIADPATSGEFPAADNRFELSSGALDTLRSRMIYVNIHSLENMGGELRGQVLPNAENYFHATLDGINETDPLAVSGLGGLKLELTNNTLVTSGSFADLAGAFDADIAGGAHLHLATVGSNGDIDFPLTTMLAADNLSGAFVASANTFELTDDQVDALRAGEYYANIHTEAQASGELRGQLLPEVNFFPTDSGLELPLEGAVIDIEGSADLEFSAAWEPAVDVDGNTIAYVWQLATDEAFENIIFLTNTAQQLFFTTNFGTVDGILAANGVEVGTEITLYHRVVVTDGSNATPGAARSVVLNRGILTGTDDLLADVVDLHVYPTQTHDQPITVVITSDEARAAELRLVDALGQTLRVINDDLVAGENRRQIDLNGLPAGRYFLSLRSEGGMLPVKTVFKL